MPVVVDLLESGSSGGLDLLSVDRAVASTARGTAWTVGAPAVLIGNSFMNRMIERRIARRGFRNLQRIAYWKRGVNYRNEPRAARVVARNRRVPQRYRQLP